MLSAIATGGAVKAGLAAAAAEVSADIQCSPDVNPNPTHDVTHSAEWQALPRHLPWPPVTVRRQR